MLQSFILSASGLSVLAGRQFPPQTYEPDPKLKDSYFGTPIWCNIAFPSGTYETLDGEVIEFEGIEIDNVLAVVNLSKNVVTTSIMGRKGTVKEYIADGDYQIEIKGALASNKQDVYPIEDFANLLEVLKAPVAVKITSEFLNQFDIDEVVITDYSFAQVEGFRDMQYFSISAISDEPIELREE